MKLPFRFTGLLGLGLLMTASNLIGQTTSSTDQQIATQQADLEKRRMELDRRSAELQQKEADLERARQTLQTQESGRSLSMNLSGDVLFDYDKATLKPEAQDALKKVGVVLSQFPESKVTVEGYTDSKGSAEHNLRLSRDRAQTVINWLVTNGGLNAANIAASGRAEDNPVAPNKNADGSDNPAGRALNRRVSIIVERPAAAPGMAVPVASPVSTP